MSLLERCPLREQRRTLPVFSDEEARVRGILATGLQNVLPKENSQERLAPCQEQEKNREFGMNLRYGLLLQR